MYRVSSGFPDKLVPRIGTVGDFALHEGKLKPRIERFCKDRVSWFKGGVENHDGGYFDKESTTLRHMRSVGCKHLMEILSQYRCCALFLNP